MIEAVRDWILERRIMFLALGVTCILYAIGGLVKRKFIERFQNGGEAAAASAEGSAALPSNRPNFEPGDCPILKRTLDAYRLAEVARESKEMAKGAAFQKAKQEIEQRFQTLDCEAYLAELAAGKVEASKSTPDMRPGPMPPIPT